MRIDKYRYRETVDSKPRERRRSRIANSALTLWRKDHPQEWDEAWPVAKAVVARCYREGTANANHANALTVMRSALATEDPITWAAYTARAAALVDAA